MKQNSSVDYFQGNFRLCNRIEFKLFFVITVIHDILKQIEQRYYFPIVSVISFPIVIRTEAKIFEKNIYDQLYHYLNENGLLNSGQSSFG